MQEPVFPQKFVRNHCLKVLEARSWRKVYKTEGTDDDDMDFAQCAFSPAGSGLRCESCKLHLTRPYENHPVDKEFLPQLEKFYKDSKEYYAWLATKKAAEKERKDEA